MAVGRRGVCTARRMRRRAAVLAVLVALAAPAGAQSSQLIDRSARGVKLAVNAQGQALLTYRARGRTWRVLAWGAVNAVAPSPNRRQVRLRLDYSGRNAQGFGNACRPYDGPQLQWLVAGCKAPDGSYWAVQAWQRLLPNYGLQPTPKQAAWELRLSHWTGELPQLTVKLNWAYRTYHHIFGRFTYLGTPVYGFRATPAGNPLDTFGRNLYVDTFNSAYGPGWKRENSFLMHRGSGAFCYGFFPHGTRPSGSGERYRATIIGPGLTPDVFWQSEAPGPYSRELDALANDAIRGLGSDTCRPN